MVHMILNISFVTISVEIFDFLFLNKHFQLILIDVNIELIFIEIIQRKS